MFREPGPSKGSDSCSVKKPEICVKLQYLYHFQLRAEQIAKLVSSAN